MDRTNSAQSNLGSFDHFIPLLDYPKDKKPAFPSPFTPKCADYFGYVGCRFRRRRQPELLSPSYFPHEGKVAILFILFVLMSSYCCHTHKYKENQAS